MTKKDDVREFLISRRAAITPARAGIPAYDGAKRRVPGLRREEVAMSPIVAGQGRFPCF